MFKDEIKRNLHIKSGLLPFALTMLSRNKLVVSGVKSVLASDGGRLRFRVSGGIVNVEGDGLEIKLMGGGDVYVTGEIGGIAFEK